MDEKDLPILHSAKKLTITFPEPLEEIKGEANATKDIVTKKCAYTPDGRLFVNRKAFSDLLVTDAKGARRVYNDLDDDDKLENGSEEYATVESVQKEISKRVQEPRDTLVRERLKYNEEALKSARDAPELEKKREIAESKIRKELPAVKRKKLKAAKVDELTGAPLNAPEVHHKDRVADNPRRALDESNLAVLNKETHRTGEDSVHKKNIETEEEFEKYKEELTRRST